MNALFNFVVISAQSDYYMPLCYVILVTSWPETCYLADRELSGFLTIERQLF